MNRRRRDEIDATYLKMALQWSKLSRARKKKVGAIIVKDGRIISDGFNGTPYGADNNCENVLEDGTLQTKEEVLHAESNAITKLAASTQSSEGATLYLTLSPCMECAKLILQSKIVEVVYIEKYRNEEPIKFLNTYVPVRQMKIELINKLLGIEDE